MTEVIILTKMHGEGKGCKEADITHHPIENAEKFSMMRGTPCTKSGFNGLVLIKADFDIHILNANDSEAERCGNVGWRIGKSDTATN